MRLPQIALLTALVLGVVLANLASGPRVFAEGPTDYSFAGGVPPEGVSLEAFSGGPPGSLSSGAPQAASFWTTVGGRLVGYIAGAPLVVNQEFVAHFPDGIPAGTPIMVVTPAPKPSPIDATAPLQFRTVCLADLQNGPPHFWRHCSILLEAGTITAIEWTVTYTPQPGVTYGGETLTVADGTRRTFFLDQTFQSTIAVDIEVCSASTCVSEHVFLDG